MAKKVAETRATPPRRRATATPPPRRTATGVTATGAVGANSAADSSAVPTPRKPTEAEIAEAAYHRYLSRGGADGADFDDWIEAERELRSRSKLKSE